MEKRGRPYKEDARKSGYRLRMNDVENAKLDYICAKTGKSKASILREALELRYKLALYTDNVDIH